ncbi:hypothetical protein GCM10028822_00290 [Hymenobacter terrigena]
MDQYRSELQQKIQRQSQLSDLALLKEVNMFLKTYGKAKHYDFILGANDSGNIVYAADARDVTNDVLAELNQYYDRNHLPGSK